MSNSYKVEGIILNSKDIKEYDRIYSVFSRQVGVFNILGVGVRKPRAKLASGLEPFTYGDIFLIKGRFLDRVRGTVIFEQFSYLKQELDFLTKSRRLFSILNQLLPTAEPNEDVFDLLYSYLRLLNELAYLKQLKQGQKTFQGKARNYQSMLTNLSDDERDQNNKESKRKKRQDGKLKEEVVHSKNKRTDYQKVNKAQNYSPVNQGSSRTKLDYWQRWLKTSLSAEKIEEVNDLLPRVLLWKVLYRHGYWAYSSVCSQCGRKLKAVTAEYSFFFSQGVFCSSCADTGSWKQKPRLRLKRDTLKLINFFISQEIGDVFRLKIDQQTGNDFKLFTQWFVEHILEKKVVL